VYQHPQLFGAQCLLPFFTLLILFMNKLAAVLP